MRGFGMAFCCGDAVLWDGITLQWCLIVGLCSVVVVLGCGMAFDSSGPGLRDGVR